MSKWMTGDPPRTGSYLVAARLGGIHLRQVTVWNGRRWGLEAPVEVEAWIEVPPLDALEERPLFWLAVDADGEEWQFDRRPSRSTYGREWSVNFREGESLPAQLIAGTVEAVLGRPLTWADEPVAVFKKTEKSA